MDKLNRKSKLKLSRKTMTRLSGSGKKGGGGGSLCSLFKNSCAPGNGGRNPGVTDTAEAGVTGADATWVRPTLTGNGNLDSTPVLCGITN